MRFSRRHLLGMGAAAAATLFLPVRRVRAGGTGSAATDGPLLFCLEADGAWDPTFLMDPKANTRLTPFTAQDIISTTASTGTVLRYAPSLDALGNASPYLVNGSDFFVKHKDTLCIVNGIDHATVSHVIGPRVAFTGSNRDGFPSLPGFVASVRGGALPMALMTSGGFVSTAGLAPITRAGSSAVLRGLADVNTLNPTAGTITHFMDADVAASVRSAVRTRTDRLAQLARSKGALREANAIGRVSDARAQAVSDALDALAPTFASASATSSDNDIIPSVASCLAAMNAGACVAAHVASTESFDTHTLHDTDHPVSMQQVLEAFDFIVDAVNNDAAYANVKARGIIIMVASDFGRSAYNGGADEGGVGKDHWPISSMMFAGVGAASALVQGGRVVGATVDPGIDDDVAGTIARKVKVQSGDLVVDDANGVTLTPGHVQRALREALGADVADFANTRYPLPTTAGVTLLPILKPL